MSTSRMPPSPPFKCRLSCIIWTYLLLISSSPPPYRIFPGTLKATITPAWSINEDNDPTSLDYIVLEDCEDGLFTMSIASEAKTRCNWILSACSHIYFLKQPVMMVGGTFLIKIAIIGKSFLANRQKIVRQIWLNRKLGKKLSKNMLP